MKADKPLTMMVADQHEEVCDPLARALGALPGIDVLAHTTNLMLAAELAHQEKPDVILADFKWGQADRAEILRWLGRMSPESVLIVYSSYFVNGERESFEEAGAARCLLKGLPVKELQAEIRRTLATVRGERPRQGIDGAESDKASVRTITAR
jgi:DNA-binding NarL/FixJ family response regulator